MRESELSTLMPKIESEKKFVIRVEKEQSDNDVKMETFHIELNKIRIESVPAVTKDFNGLTVTLVRNLWLLGRQVG